MARLSAQISSQLERDLGAEVQSIASLSGGDMAEAFAVDLSDGRRVFAKTHADPPKGFFGREADDLRWLATAGALPLPDVLAVSDSSPAFLALSWIDAGRRGQSDEVAFGRDLAALHESGSPCFGRSDGRTTGSQALPNDPCETWVEFFADRRLLPLARIASDQLALPPAICSALERAAGDLSELAGPPEPPARLHGDLWAGNRMVDHAGRSWLIDPAAHGGHREFDLAMMRLFGGFGDEAFRAYHDVFALADGWERRVRLHQLAPLVVHAIKFGGGYVGAVEDALDSLSMIR